MRRNITPTPHNIILKRPNITRAVTTKKQLTTPIPPLAIRTMLRTTAKKLVRLMLTSTARSKNERGGRR